MSIVGGERYRGVYGKDVHDKGLFVIAAVILDGFCHRNCKGIVVCDRSRCDSDNNFLLKTPIMPEGLI